MQDTKENIRKLSPGYYFLLWLDLAMGWIWGMKEKEISHVSSFAAYGLNSLCRFLRRRVLEKDHISMGRDHKFAYVRFSIPLRYLRNAEEAVTYKGPGCGCTFESLRPVDGNQMLASVIVTYCRIKK